MGQLTKTFTRNKQLLSVPNYRINDDFINTLQDNHLVNDLMHQKNNIHYFKNVNIITHMGLHYEETYEVNTHHISG